MAQNYVLLERIELNASAASVTFANIPQSGYTDLKVVTSVRGTNSGGGTSGAWDNFTITFNGSSSNVSSRWLTGVDAAPSSGNSSTAIYTWADYNGATANTFSSTEFYIPNYTSSNYKSVSIDTVTENNSSTGLQGFTAGLWSNTAAITSVTLTPNGGSWAQYSTFSLYGLAAVGTTPVIAPKASGGNTVVTDGTYWYHAFLSSGTFTPMASISCDVLQVAGGGGGDSGGGGGGGGAGGYLTFTGQSLTATSYTLTIGAGGAALGTTPSAGSNTQFGSLTASAGGGRAVGGGSAASQGNGGSGGGATGGQTVGGGTATPSGQGNNGGSATFSAPYGGGGGGGAGSAGGNGGVSSTAGAGGNGLYTAISGGATTGLGQLSGGNYYFAGGGGGARNNVHGGTAGAGGLGGGGNGGGQPGTNGTANTGGGGGGNEASGGAASNGGSGIVIVRYAV